MRDNKYQLFFFIIFILLFIQNSGIYAEKNDTLDNDWALKNFSLGIAGGFSESGCSVYYPNLDSCYSNTPFLEIVLHFIYEPFWQVTFDGGIDTRTNLYTNFRNYSVVPVYAAILTGYVKSLDDFRFYAEAGMHVVLTPFYYGPEISAGVEWLAPDSIAVGIKLNAMYLIDSSSTGNRLSFIPGFWTSYRDSHFVLEPCITVSYVFD